MKHCYRGPADHIHATKNAVSKHTAITLCHAVKCMLLIVSSPDLVGRSQMLFVTIHSALQAPPPEDGKKSMKRLWNNPYMRLGS